VISGNSRHPRKQREKKRKETEGEDEKKLLTYFLCRTCRTEKKQRLPFRGKKSGGKRGGKTNPNPEGKPPTNTHEKKARALYSLGRMVYRIKHPRSKKGDQVKRKKQLTKKAAVVALL